MSAIATAKGAIATLRAVIEEGILQSPRTLQRALGPSEIGNDCDRCLAHMLHDAYVSEIPTRRDETDVPWLPYIGTCVHSGLADILESGGHTDDDGDWLSEHRVTVGKVGDFEIRGSLDAFHKPTGVVVDYKIVGTTTMNKVGYDGSGCSLTYQRQIQCYGAGLAAEGYQVNAVAVWFLPRNALSINKARLYIAEFDPTIARDTLTRASYLLQGIQTYGLQAMLDVLPPHTYAGFTCERYKPLDRSSLSALLKR